MKESREYEDDHEKYIFQIYTTKGDSYFVNLAQIHDIIGDETWFNGETKCLSNIASNRMISLSWGAKKKEFSNSTETPSISSCPCVGDHVIVSNQENDSFIFYQNKFEGYRCKSDFGKITKITHPPNKGGE